MHELGFLHGLWDENGNDLYELIWQITDDSIFNNASIDNHPN